MIVIKYNGSRIEGFNVLEFWFSEKSFNYTKAGSSITHSIFLMEIKEVIVDGTTIYQSEV